MTAAEALAVFLPAGLALLMANVGLHLSLRDMTFALRHPRALVVGLAVQIVALPLAAIVLSRAFGLSPEMSLGLLLAAAAPGGVTSNYITLLIGADIALSAAMTLVSTFLCSLTLPLVLALGMSRPLLGSTELAAISLGMAGLAVAPLVAGMVFRRAFPRWSVDVRRVLGPISRLVFLAIVLSVFVRDWHAIRVNWGEVGPACFALNLTAIALAAGAGVIARLSPPQRRAIVVEASLQNVAVSIFIAYSVLNAPVLAIPGLVYVVAMNLSALVHIGICYLQPRTPVAAT